MKNFKNTLLLAMLIFSIIKVNAQDFSTIRGEVISKEGNKLESVNVTLLNTSYGAATNKDGLFEIKNIPPGSYVLEASFIGFTTVVKNITTKNNEVIVLEIQLEEFNNILDAVQIKGQSFDIRNSATTVNVIGTDRIKNLMSTITKPLQLIEHVPGVNIDAFGQGGTSDTFTIRGFSGGHSGRAGVEVDGISLTEAEAHSDGYSDFNVLIPLNLSKVNVYKGPSSALFGRFSQGGTIAMETRKGGEYIDLMAKTGSYNSFDIQYAQGSRIKLGETDKALQTNFALQLFSTDGYTDNSDVLKGNFDGRISYNLTDKTDISLSVRGHRSKWQAPEYISEEQYLDRELRKRQTPGDEDNQGGNKTFTSQRIDLNHKLSENVNLLVFGYALQQDFFRYRTRRLESNSRDVYSFGGSINGNTHIAKKDFDWTVGMEYYTEGTNRDHYNSTFRKLESRRLDDDFDAKTFSAFAQGELDIHKLFRPSIGVRFDTYGGGFKSFDLITGALVSDFKIDDLSHISPKMGFRSTLVDDVLDFRASVSNGFALPNRTFKYEFDNLEPVELWQYEIGLTVTQNNWLEIDVAGFIINSSKEIQEFPDNSGIYINAGKSRRSGIEAKVDAILTDGLELIATTSFIDTEFVDHPDYEGNKLQRLPENITTLSANYTSPIGLGTNIHFRNVGEYYRNNENTKKYGGHAVTNLTVFYNFNKMFADKGRVFFTVNNLFDKLYANVALGSSFSPAPTRNVMVGVNYSF